MKYKYKYKCMNAIEFKVLKVVEYLANDNLQHWEFIVVIS
jgi:hypothetical protein